MYGICENVCIFIVIVDYLLAGLLISGIIASGTIVGSVLAIIKYCKKGKDYYSNNITVDRNSFDFLFYFGGLLVLTFIWHCLCQ